MLAGMRRLSRTFSAGLLCTLGLLLVAPGVASGAPGVDAQPPPSETRPAAPSVYRVRLAIDLPVIGLGIVGTLIPYALSSQLITHKCPCDPGEVNAFDRPAIGNRSRWAGPVSNVTVGMAIAAPVLLDAALVGLNRTFLEDAVVFTQVITTNLFFVTWTKHLVGRPLPRTYEGIPSLVGSDDGYRSFYSGHTSFAFASLSAAVVTTGLRYDRWLLPSLLALVVGGSVAAEGVVGGYHFPTDVIVGALAGTAIGTTLPLLHARPRPVHFGLRSTPSGATTWFAAGRF